MMDNELEKLLESFLPAVPEAQQPLLRDRLIRAYEAGWTQLGLWTYGDPPDASDLVGIPPGEQCVAFAHHRGL